MKKNRDKLNDALGMVDEVLMQGAMSHAEGMRAAQISRRAMIRRRVAVLAAACLSMALLAGAVLALPALRSDEPDVPPVTVDQTEGSEIFYVEAPMVKISRLSVTETAEITDPSIPADTLSTQVSNVNDWFSYYTFMDFDCEPGETVTLTAGTDCLAVIDRTYEEVLDMGEIIDSELGLLKYIHPSKQPYMTDYPRFETTVTLDPSVACVYVQIPGSRGVDYDEDVISFTVRNAEGQITGIGTVCVGRHYMLTVEERAARPATNNPTVTRAAIVDSVRFLDPATVTEEQVNALVAEFEAKTDAAFDSMDYTPATAFEARFAAYAEIVSMVLAEDGQIMGSSGSAGDSRDYSYFRMAKNQVTDEKGFSHRADERQFIIMNDGTWFEIEGGEEAPADCTMAHCHADPNCPLTAEKGLHHPVGSGCHVTAKDGRVFELTTADWENNIPGTPKLIYDPAA